MAFVVAYISLINPSFVVSNIGNDIIIISIKQRDAMSYMRELTTEILCSTLIDQTVIRTEKREDIYIHSNVEINLNNLIGIYS